MKDIPFKFASICFFVFTLLIKMQLALSASYSLMKPLEPLEVVRWQHVSEMKDKTF